MKTLKLGLYLFFMLLLSESGFGQTENKIFFGEKNLIHSNILGEDREYWVHLPADYEKSSNNYPVLYLTDGDEHFFLASGLIKFMSSQFMIPEMIVVAVFHNDRNRDLTPTHSETFVNGRQSDAAKVSGGGEKFLQFIGDELIGQVERQYRASSYRILAGHSLGGLFCIYAYLKRNDLFIGFISMDPALNWDNNVCEQMLKSSSAKVQDFKSKLYISSAHNAAMGKRDRGPFRISQESFIRELNKQGISNRKFEIFEDEKHLTVPYRSLYSGLTYLFPDYYIFNNPEFIPEIPFIQKFYAHLSELYGLKIIPPEYLIEMLGKYYLFDINEYAKAIEFFTLNGVNYPDAYQSYEFLAKAYLALGDSDNARVFYKKSLLLNPGNQEIQQALLELESK